MGHGILYVVSTPIGNLKDITFRAVDVLRSVDIIASEDTRRTRILLNRYEISRPLVSYHSYNRVRSSASLLKSLEGGRSVALVSDAGTPGISDPGFHLIREAIERGIQVIPVPGPSSLLAALVASGLPMDRVCFRRIPAREEGEEKKTGRTGGDETYSRAVRRTASNSETAAGNQGIFFGIRNVAVARELTKIYEEFFRGSVEQAITYFTDKKPRGEFVIVIEGRQRNA